MANTTLPSVPASLPPHGQNQLIFFQKTKKKKQSKHLSLCSGRQGLQPAQMEFILCSVIQSIRAQDVAGRVEPKNASLKQLNFMLCVQRSLGLAETSSFHGVFCNSCCSNELLVQWKGWGLWLERGRRGTGTAQIGDRAYHKMIDTGPAE